MSERDGYRAAIVTSTRWAGSCLVVDPVDDRQYGFRFDRIEKYRGENVKELGLKAGKIVLIRTEDDKVVSVKLTQY